jgi:DNA-binding SARP family transcriptional activator/DNA-binding beta-propeller fold protein YncE
VEFRILGPLEVLEDGRPLPLGRLKERIVLAVLLLHANEFVSRERLIDEIWGPAPPPTARKAVNVYVSKLRKTLTHNGHDPIATVAAGYRLQLGPEDLDTERLQRLLAHARDRVAAGELETASGVFREALALWRGPTLPDLPFESFARAEVEQLDELRLAALMDRIDCDLALGRHDQVLGELNLFVREHPLRERLRAQQMLALYRADRQADALDAFAEARRTLVDDLGIEPSEALQRLQQAILRHDPSLETPEGTAAVNGLPPTAPTPAVAAEKRAPRRRFRPRRRRLAVAILSTSSARATPPILPNSLVRLDPRSGRVVSVARMGADPGDLGAISVTPTAIWTANQGDGTISRYDLRTHRVETRGGLPWLSDDPVDHVVADADGNAWFTSEMPMVTRLTPGAGGTSAPLHSLKAQTIDVPGPAVGYEALGGGYLWTVVGPYTFPGQDDRLSVINPVSNVVVDSVRLGRATTALAFGDGTAWVGAWMNEGNGPPAPSLGASWLYAIRTGGGDEAQPFLDRHPLRRLLTTGDTWGPVGIAVGEGAVWVLTCGICNQGPKPYLEHRMLLKIDPDTLQVLKRIPLDRQTDYLAVGAGAVWLTAAKDRFVWQLDPTTGRTLRAIPLRKKGGAHTCGIAATSKAVWVTTGGTTPAYQCG